MVSLYSNDALSLNEGDIFGKDFQLGSISGQKFEDINGNGHKDRGERGLAGWTIFIDEDGDGILDKGEYRTYTNDHGNYRFTDLEAGHYDIREVQQRGWQQTTANPHTIKIQRGSDVIDVDFGNFKLGKITGQKFEDINGNGHKDRGEQGLARWTIFIDDNNNGYLDNHEVRTHTDAHGNYIFRGFKPGSYTIREVQQEGWKQTTPNPKDIHIQSGTIARHVDFGNFKLGKITGQKFEDLNGNGYKDQGEKGLAGWTIFIDDNNNGYLDNHEVRTHTNAHGNYILKGLKPGSYTIREVQQEGWQQTTPNPEDIHIQSGTLARYVDFGNQRIDSKPEIDLEIIKEFKPLREEVPLNIFDYGDTITIELEVRNNSDSIAEDVKIIDPFPSKLNNIEIVSDLPEGAHFFLDPHTNVLEISLPTLDPTEDHPLIITLNADVVVPEHLVVFDLNSQLGNNPALREYGSANLKGKLNILPETVRKTNGSSIVEFDINSITNEATISAPDIVDPKPENNTSSDTGEIPFGIIEGPLANGEDFLFYITDDPLIDVDWGTGGGGDTGNSSDFLPAGTIGKGFIDIFFDNKKALAEDPNYEDFFLPLETEGLENPAQKLKNQKLIVDYLETTIVRKDAGFANFVEGFLELDNGEETEEINFESAQFTPDLSKSDTVNIVVIKHDDDDDEDDHEVRVVYADSDGNPIPGSKSLGNTLQKALDNIAPAENPATVLNIFINESVSETRLNTLSFNSLEEKNYLVQSLEIQSDSIHFTVANKKPANIDLSLIQVEATEETSNPVILKENNKRDHITGSELDDIIVGGTRSDVLRGGPGDDTLIGGKFNPKTGHISKTGGDTYVLETTAGTDIVKGYNRKTDAIGLLSGIAESSLALTSQGHDTIISIKNTDPLIPLMRVENTDPEEINFTSLETNII